MEYTTMAQRKDTLKSVTVNVNGTSPANLQEPPTEADILTDTRLAQGPAAKILVSCHDHKPVLESTLVERGATVTQSTNSPELFHVDFPASGEVGPHGGLWREAKGPLRVSVWLDTTIHSHDIVAHREAALDFKEKTGLDAPWPTHTVRATRAAIRARGVGGEVAGEPEQLMAWGYEMAEALARLLVPNFHSYKTGRGGIYSDAVEALRRAGV